MKTPVKKMDKLKEDSNKKVGRILQAFKEMGKTDVREEALYQEIRSHYETLSEPGKERLFKAIIEEIEVSREALGPVLEKLAASNTGDPAWFSLISDLRQKTTSPRLSIFRKISRLPGGLKFLLDFRGDLISIQRFSKTDLKPLDSDITLLFDLWFQDGFLYLEEITLNSSYKQIEFIKNSDLVHPMTGIEEMSRRLGKDRRCFALYHRLIPYEPVIFIEVALTRGIARKISEIIWVDSDRELAKDADTAVFYSINNTQTGLSGIGLGKMLIGQVVDYIGKKNEQIKNFATLSPMPGFWKNYLRPILEGEDEAFILKQGDVQSYFSKKQTAKIMGKIKGRKDDVAEFNKALLSILAGKEWIKNEELMKSLRGPLVKIAFHYISKEKNPQGNPLNPVAGFHLGNGATVVTNNVNFLANPSERGLKESCGLMVNYIYTSTWLNQVRRSLSWVIGLKSGAGSSAVHEGRG